MKTPRDFIVVDDDLINNLVCRIVIQSTIPDADIHAFNLPEAGFIYIEKEFAPDEKEKPTVLFLDINMPRWTGWDFLENFEKLDEKIKKQIEIYMLSSSVDSDDIDRAKSNPNVVDYFIKPLTREMVSMVISR